MKNTVIIYRTFDIFSPEETIEFHIRKIPIKLFGNISGQIINAYNLKLTEETYKRTSRFHLTRIDLLNDVLSLTFLKK